jgi:NAD(P)-dependent dehydrogenase (short-subunit alcohol dehydrogenase family)
MASPPGTVRIVNVTSDGHSLFAPSEGIKFDDINMEAAGSMTRYGQSKLGNVLHAKELNRRYGPGSGVEGAIWTAAVHPGHIHT